MSELETIEVKEQNMNEFTVHIVFSASLSIFSQNILSSFKKYFNEEISLEADWRVALSETIFRATVNQVSKKRFEDIFVRKRP